MSINFNLRKIAPTIKMLLKKKATKNFHDLDALAGTWSEEDKNAFDQCIKSFEQIDKDMWS